MVEAIAAGAVATSRARHRFCLTSADNGAFGREFISGRPDSMSHCGQLVNPCAAVPHRWPSRKLSFCRRSLLGVLRPWHWRCNGVYGMKLAMMGMILGINATMLILMV